MLETAAMQADQTSEQSVKHNNPYGAWSVICAIVGFFLMGQPKRVMCIGWSYQTLGTVWPTIAGLLGVTSVVLGVLAIRTARVAGRGKVSGGCGTALGCIFMFGLLAVPSEMLRKS